LENVKHIDAIIGFIEVIAEGHIEQRTPDTENTGVRAGGEADGDVGDLDTMNGPSFRGKKIDMPPIA
jgi:hypothetical protein